MTDTTLAAGATAGLPCELAEGIVCTLQAAGLRDPAAPLMLGASIDDDLTT